MKLTEWPFHVKGSTLHLYKANSILKIKSEQWTRRQMKIASQLIKLTKLFENWNDRFVN